MTHIGSNWELLSEFLQKDKRFMVYQTGREYHHPNDVIDFSLTPHHRDNSAAVRVDVILNNSQFTMRRLAQYYNFIFWQGDFEDSLNNLIIKENYDENQAETYLDFRIQMMKQYYRRKPNSLWNPELKGDSFFETIFGRKNSVPT